MSDGLWTAAGSEAPRRFRNQGRAGKAVSPLRSATAVHNFALRAVNEVVMFSACASVLLASGNGVAGAMVSNAGYHIFIDWRVSGGAEVTAATVATASKHSRG